MKTSYRFCVNLCKAEDDCARGRYETSVEVPPSPDADKSCLTYTDDPL